ncbi:hypothetical protein GCM10027290_50140 [Micromonospora sonneratiae]
MEPDTGTDEAVGVGEDVDFAEEEGVFDPDPDSLGEDSGSLLPVRDEPGGEWQVVRGFGDEFRDGTDFGVTGTSYDRRLS